MYNSLYTPLDKVGRFNYHLIPHSLNAFAKGMSMLNKTDKADSEALSRYGYTAKLIIWQPEPENVRLLKALLGRRDVYLGSLLQEKNRLEKAQSTLP